MSTFTDRFKTRPASFSFFSSWEYNKDEWYDNYILGKRKESNAQMEFGTLVGDSIGTPESLVPTLVPPGVKEYELRAKVGDVYLVGYCDHYDPITKTLNENKTTVKKDKWTQQSVDEHKQLDMYALLLMLQDKVHPKELTIYLNYIPVELKGVGYKLPKPPTYVQIETKRTALQVAQYAQYIKDTVKLMEQYVNNK